MVSENVIEMQTLRSGRAAGLAEIVGSLEIGKRADLVLRASVFVELAPGIEPAHQRICVGHDPTADTVLAIGRIVLSNRRSTLVDEAAIFAEARALVQRMSERLGLTPPGLWPRGRLTSHGSPSPATKS
jgi:5-methylthioadenosine/S-adenosylhomocysteine deaminase